MHNSPAGVSQFTANGHFYVENEIINIVKMCKPKNSTDCDDNSMYVICKVIIPIVKPLAHI